MKKSIRICGAAIILGCMMAFPAQAAQTRAEYRTQAAPVRAELKEAAASLKELREENKASAAGYKAVRLSKKETGALSVDKEDWKQARELHGQIADLRKEMGKSEAKGLMQEAKAAAKQKDYDTALDRLKQVLEIRKDRLEAIEQIHSLWQEIDALLAE